MTTDTKQAMQMALEALELSKEQLAGDRLELIACHAWPAGSGEIPEHDRAGTQALREYDECLTAADAAITALRAAMADDGWRPIETMPRDSGTYLVADAKRSLVAPHIRGVIHNNTGTCWDWQYGEAITHWRPLPAAPKD